jgi:anaerobic selenocysteine-containing dehydrogenase
MNKTTCPLDCYDACSVVYEEGKLKGDKAHPVTNGYLCPNLNHYLQEPRILVPRFKGEEITLDKAMEILTDLLKEAQPMDTLYFKGEGNFGRLQNAPAHFFSQYGAAFTKGSLCDGAGEAGVIEGRGESLSLPYEQIAKSRIVVVWGRNISVTNSHFMDLIKDKILIVIDPVKTELAKKAAIHLQVKPREDLFLAILMARFVYIEQIEDYDFIDNFTNDFDYFVEFIRSFTVKELTDRVGVELEDVLTALMLMDKEKVSFLVGVGVQKYAHGSSVLRAIDSLAAMMGLFAKEGCGVSYLGNSMLGFKDIFPKGKKQVPKAAVDFGKYDLVFIQGSNPANQMPNTAKVREGFKKCKFSVYFGLYENETSELADLVIPAKNFLEKEDIRFSYGTDFVGRMPALVNSETGISEVNLTNLLCKAFDYETLPDEKSMIEEIVGNNIYEKNGYLRNREYKQIPYSDGFYTDDEKFQFIDEYEDEICDAEGFFLITCKQRHSLNSQFKRDTHIYVPPVCGFADGETVRALSPYGEAEFVVKIDENLRDDCVMIYSGTPGVNYLTPDALSEEGESAIYQETRIVLEKIDV